MSDYQFNPNVEQWKEIPGFPGYEVSDHGRARSYWKHYGLGAKGGSKCVIEPDPQRILKPIRNWQEYSFVGINKKMIKICRLVLIAFVGFCPHGHEICHNNGIRTDDHLCNLRYDTPSNNQMDRRKHGTDNGGTRNGQSKLNSHAVI
jgi:hypothetical protein